MVHRESKVFLVLLVRSPKRPTHKVRMKKIPCPLSAPTTAEIELAKTDADARKRVRNQMLRVRRRDEEIARLKAENADGVCGDCLDGDAVDAVDAVDYGAVDAVDYGADDDADRFVRIPSWCLDVLCLCAICDRDQRQRPFVLARRIAISGFLSVRTEQHAGMR